MKPEVIGLRGGQKTMWLRRNKGEVLKFYHEHGMALTLAEFNLGYLALEGVLRAAVAPDPEYSSPTPAAPGPDLEAINMRLDVIQAGVAEVRGKERRLEEAFTEFVPSVTEGILKRLVPALVDGLARSIQLPPGLEGTGDDEDENETKGAG